MNVFTEKLKELRKKHGLTQGELSEKTGISRRVISSLELNYNEPNLPQLIKLSEFFGVTTDYLIKGIEVEKIITDTEQEMIEVLRGDRDMTNAVMEFAKIKKKAISFTRSYAANQNAAMG